MPVKTAVVGAGYLGKFHVEKYAQLPNSQLVAVVDNNADTVHKLASMHDVEAYTDYRMLFGKVEAVSVSVPTSMHYAIARDMLQQGIHVLLEKPITVTIDEASELIELANAKQCVLQVGHLERFNPAIIALGQQLCTPKFIETHRLAPYKTRATDVDVVLDLMIHDIDIILSLVKAEITHIDASGARVLSDSIDIANTRLNFANGCVANVTASRVSLKAERKMRIFQEENYISVDFQNRVLSRHYKSVEEDSPSTPKIKSDETVYEDGDALKTEIAAFLQAIENKTPPLVSGEDGRRALDTAIQITDLLTHSL